MSLELDLSQQGIPSVELGQSKESREHLATVSPAHLKAIKRGISSALSAGPLLSFPVGFQLEFVTYHSERKASYWNFHNADTVR